LRFDFEVMVVSWWWAGFVSEHVGLMDFDNVAIGVVQEDLVPTGDSPAAVVRIADTHGVALAHETLNVIGAEAEVAMTHGVDELLHLVARVEVALGPVELDVTVGQEVDFAGVGPVITLAADYRVCIVGDGPQLEQRLVELCEPRQVIRAEVHVMKLELHSDLAFMEVVKLPPQHWVEVARSMDEQCDLSTLTKRYQSSPVKSTMHI
jgi:hypothetical protein